jgi:hypothetical protein
LRRHLTGALLAAGTALAICAVPALPAAAATSGPETIKATIVTSGVSGTRTVISSVVVAKGVFTGVGSVVEIDNLPGDPDNVSRDILVFRTGTLSLLTTNLSADFTVNQHNCLFSGTLQQAGQIVGGTGQFANASGSYTGTARGQGLLPRAPDGSCDFGQASLHEVDRVAGSGTLSF